MKTSVPSIVTFKVFAEFNGVAMSPFVKSPDNTSAPNTWYNKISVKSGEANKSPAVIPRAVNASPKAASVGANTVNEDHGFVKAGNKRASITAATNVV